MDLELNCKLELIYTNENIGSISIDYGDSEQASFQINASTNSSAFGVDVPSYLSPLPDSFYSGPYYLLPDTEFKFDALLTAFEFYGVYSGYIYLSVTINLEELTVFLFDLIS